MAFLIQNWCRASASANEPISTLDSGVIVGCFRQYNYQSADTQLTIAASGYFDNVEADLVTGDYIQVYSTTDDSLMRYRVTNTSGVITTALKGGIVQTVTAITAAQINAMYTTPIELIAAPGADRVLLLESVTLVPSNALTTDYTAGGAVHIQYNDTTAGGGVVASGTVAAAEFTSDAETTMSIFTALTASGDDATAAEKIENEGLYLSNASQDFATGTITYNAYSKASVIAVSAGWN